MLQVPASGDKVDAAQTVYTVRMCTGSSRGSGMTEQRAGVWLGLVGHDGSAYMHRAVPLSDPEVIEQELIEICQVILCSSFPKLANQVFMVFWLVGCRLQTETQVLTARM